MDRGYREEMIATLHPRARRGAVLTELDREYSLTDIAVITRSGPARALGLKNKGHLGAGDDADIAVYEEQADKEAMFARPQYVYKGGELVARDGAVIKQVMGRTYSVAPDYDTAIEDDLRAHFKAAYTVSYDNYAMLSGDGARTETVACG
jgi:formylmethanofuran dehydrogenase subunit A